jgi:hypothetical protein
MNSTVPSQKPMNTTAPSGFPSSLSSNMDKLVGPIGEEYCYYFYILSLLAIIFFAMIFVGIIWTGITKKMGFSFFFLSLLSSSQFLLIYLQNRLLYNMCIHSIKG